MTVISKRYLPSSSLAGHWQARNNFFSKLTLRLDPRLPHRNDTPKVFAHIPTARRVGRSPAVDGEGAARQPRVPNSLTPGEAWGTGVSWRPGRRALAVPSQGGGSPDGLGGLSCFRPVPTAQQRSSTPVPTHTRLLIWTGFGLVIASSG